MGWSLGLRYRLSDADIKLAFPQVTDAAQLFEGFSKHQDLEATLHQLTLSAIYNHRSGFFGEIDGVWYSQSSRGYTPDPPSEAFWQLNLLAGYWFPRRCGQIAIGLLNANGQNYHLNPLNLYNDLPRERTLVVRAQVNF